MTTDYSYPELVALEQGLYHLTAQRKHFFGLLTKIVSLGWVSVEHKGDFVELMWTSHKYHHQRGFGVSAKLLKLRTDGSIYLYQESKISMWITWGLGIGTDKDLEEAREFGNWIKGHLQGRKPDAPNLH